MDVGKNYVFYNNEYLFGREENIMVGTLLGEDRVGSGIYAFKLIDDGKTIRYSSSIHDELNTYNVLDFMERVSQSFQNNFERNVSIIHEDYEFIVSIPKYIDEKINIGKIEETMDEVLEDYWSVQLQEINHCIQIKMTTIELKFRVHDVHEVQFRYYKEEE
jgi:hypothetical protein